MISEELFNRGSLLVGLAYSAFTLFVSSLSFRFLALVTRWPFRLFWTLVFFTATASDYFVYAASVRNSPSFHKGYSVSVVIPVLVFYPTLLFCLFKVFQVLFAGFSLNGVKKCTSGIFAVTVLKIACAIAYGSPAGAALVAFDLVLAIVKWWKLSSAEVGKFKTD
jgi:hypothetical protein